MKAKKLTAIFLTAILAVGLITSCGTSNSGQPVSDSDNKATNESETEAEKAETDSETAAEEIVEDASAATESGKTLVVYYSATGTTKSVAETVAELTCGELFEIEPKEIYTSEDLDWTKKDSRVSREHDDEGLRDVELVSVTVDNWDSYDTVYIGYPIWWGSAAWPVDGFVKANDFTGKTVIPFCTAASSGIGDSGKFLKDMAGTGDWKDGEGFRGGASESDIRSWIDGLGL